MPAPIRVYAIVVCYNPALSGLKKLIKALLPQVERILLVDNGSRSPTIKWLQALAQKKNQLQDPRIEIIYNGHNLGVAAAQNVGICQALANGASHVAIFDHDSLPSHDAISQLLSAEIKLTHNKPDLKIAALGPAYIDTKTNEPSPFIRLSGWRVLRQTPQKEQDWVIADYLISSGTLIPAAALREIGLMDEQLFIDYIDIEWGLRSKAKGYTCIGVPAATMSHTIGEEAIKLPFVRRHVNLHSSNRHYFLYRNALWLYRRQYVPVSWKIQDAARMLIKIPLYVVSSSNKGEELRCITKGLASGLSRQTTVNIPPIPLTRTQQ